MFLPLRDRHAEKTSKHSAEAAAAGRVLFPFVSDTLGTVGPPEFAAWFKSLFGAAARAAAAHDRSAAATAQFNLDLALAELLALLVRDNVAAITRLTIHDRT